ELQRVVGILFDDQDGQAVLAVERPNGVENLAGDQGREPERWFVEQKQARAAHQRSASLESVASAPICRFSATLIRGKIRRPSGDCAMRKRAISWVGTPVMSRPSNKTWPARALGLPKIVIISVDLPAPLAPISATISLELMSRS